MNRDALLGDNSSELTALGQIFEENNETSVWKFELILTTSDNLSSSFSLAIQVNQLPMGGSCFINPLSGMTLDTIFTIQCLNWRDLDGTIVKYNFYAGMVNNQMKISLGYSLNGILETQLPQGAIYDSNRMYISVEIVDDDNGITYYDLSSTSVTVNSNLTQLGNIMDQILKASSSSDENKVLFSGNTMQSVQIISSLSSMMSTQNMEDKKGFQSSSTHSFPQTYGPSSNLSGVAPTPAMTSSVYEEKRNLRSNVKDVLVSFAAKLSVSDMNSLRSVASMLATLTSQPDELTRNSVDTLMNKCIELTLLLKNTFSDISSIDELKQASIGIIATIGNLNSALSLSLNGREPYLQSDYKEDKDPPAVYDTDLENFWTNPTHFQSEDVNTLKQKFQNTDANQKMSSILNELTSILSDHTPVGSESLNIETPSLLLLISKSTSGNMTTPLTGMKSPSFCDLVTNGDEKDCSSQSQILTTRSMSSPMATSGQNGNNETFVGLSSALDLTFTYSAETEPITIQNSKSPIEMWIPRDSVANSSFQRVNATNMTISSLLHYMPNSFFINSSNASVHIELGALNASIGYLVSLKMGYMPILNATYADVDHFRIFCPRHTENGTTFLFFLNMSQIKGYRGFVGFGIRELNLNETNAYCDVNEAIFYNTPPLIDYKIRFTSDFLIRTFTSGCYFYDTASGRWSSHGMEILEDSTLELTHCLTYNLS